MTCHITSIGSLYGCAARASCIQARYRSSGVSSAGVALGGQVGGASGGFVAGAGMVAVCVAAAPARTMYAVGSVGVSDPPQDASSSVARTSGRQLLFMLDPAVPARPPP